MSSNISEMEQKILDYLKNKTLSATHIGLAITELPPLAARKEVEVYLQILEEKNILKSMIIDNVKYYCKSNVSIHNLTRGKNLSQNKFAERLIIKNTEKFLESLGRVDSVREVISKSISLYEEEYGAIEAENFQKILRPVLLHFKEIKKIKKTSFVKNFNREYYLEQCRNFYEENKHKWKSSRNTIIQLRRFLEQKTEKLLPRNESKNSKEYIFFIKHIIYDIIDKKRNEVKQTNLDINVNDRVLVFHKNTLLKGTVSEIVICDKYRRRNIIFKDDKSGKEIIKLDKFIIEKI